VALRALPKRADDPVLEEQDERPPRRLPPGDQRSRHGRGVVLIAFWLSVGVTCVAATLVVVIREPSAATTTCPPPQRCPGPPPDVPPSRSATWTADAGGHVRLRYPVKLFSVDESTDTVLRLQVQGERPSDVEASLWVTASRQSDEQPEQLVQDRRAALSSTLLGLTPDDDPATAVTQLRVGRFDATGGSYRGTVDTPLGPTRPASVIIGSAGNGRTAVVFSYVITGTDDISTISQLRQYLSPVLTSVTWGR
jgi:hypothetical protein